MDDKPFFWIRRARGDHDGLPICHGRNGGREACHLSASYGAEVRGGTANCTVVISSEEIASPVASEPDYAVFMNYPSLFRFQNQIQSGGTIFLNSSMIESRPIRGDLEIYEIPVNDLAKQLKADKVTNMIMLGAFIKKSGVVSLETMNHVLKDTFGNRNPAILKLNKSALQLGYNYLE
jgi:2-oxoglutarate ferredoxin oxidoreductase subunit gamma